MTLEVAFLVDFDGHPVYDTVTVVHTKTDLFKFLSEHCWKRFCFIRLPYDQNDVVDSCLSVDFAKRLVRKVFK